MAVWKKTESFATSTETEVGRRLYLTNGNQKVLSEGNQGFSRDHFRENLPPYNEVCAA